MTDLEAIARLRHDLRNEVNHIVGYGELLAEESDADGGSPFGSALAEITGAGRDVRAALDRLLSTEHVATVGFDQAALIETLEPPLGRVAARAATLAGDAGLGGGAGAAEDLARIERSARAAIALVSGFVPDGVSREAPVPHRGAADAGTAQAPEPGGSGTVLIADDDAENRDILARWLERLGYVPVEAVDGRQALDTLRTRSVDLVLLDLHMPHVDGFGVLDARHADARLRDIPTIMISGSGEHESIVRCIEMGAEDYLPKPFDPVLLRARVGACLEKKRLRDQERALLATVSEQAAQLAEWNQRLEARVATQVEELERLARLRRFLSPQLADLIVGDERVLATHRRDIAVLFCDLRGFTAFAESAEPEDVMGVLGEYHRCLGELVHRFEATVGFFAGDGLMVFFNDPLPCPDAAARALRLAVAMREHMGELTDAWRRRGFELGFGVGIASGYATLGEIGFDGRVDYGVIGSVVNLAARLCDRAGPGQILVSQRAVLAAGEIARYEEVGKIELKGFHAPVGAFAVVDLAEVPA